MYVYVIKEFEAIDFPSLAATKNDFMKSSTKRSYGCRRHRTIVFLLVLFHFQSAVAQQNIKGLLTDNNSEPLYNANALLLNARDTSLVKGTMTDKSGHFFFNDVSTGKYLVSFSLIGFKQTHTPAFSIDTDEKDLGLIELKQEPTQLDQVIINKKLPLLEQRVDRLVVNVKNSIIASGNTALEILERSPGVTVNRQSNTIMMGGKDGVVIMINGKISHMPISAIVQMLAGMNAGNIEKIELITTPPASFDAEGNAGFINIILVNSSEMGTNGGYTMTAGYGQGIITNASINVNHRTKKLNLYGDYSFNRARLGQRFLNYRKIMSQGNAIESYTVNDREPVQRIHGFRLGLDYKVNKKTLVGVLFAGNDNRWSMEAKNQLSTFTNQQLDTFIKATNGEINYWKNLMGNANLHHTFSKGEVLSVDVDYLYYDLDNPNHYHNLYFDNNKNPVSEERIRISKVTPIKIVVGKADYSRNINEKISVETGVKLSVTSLYNDVKVENLSQREWITDQSLSAGYKLKEEIAAVYTVFNLVFNEKLNIKAGLRYEYTTTNLSTVKQEDIVDRQYGYFFPSIFITRKIDDDRSLNLSFTQRITRPTYKDIAPFVLFADPKIFFSGNPQLRPSISNTIKAGFTFKGNLFSISYSHDNNPIAQFQSKVDTVTNRQYITTENLKNMKTLSATIAIPLQIGERWNIQNNILAGWQQVNAFYRQADVRINQATYRITSTNSFTLPKEYSLEVGGFYQSPTFWGMAVLKPIGSVDIGAQKKFKKGSIRFNVNDVFNTIKYKPSLNIPSQNLITESQYLLYPRSFRLTYTRNFGNDELKANRSRATGSEEERRRAQ